MKPAYCLLLPSIMLCILTSVVKRSEGGQPPAVILYAKSQQTWFLKPLTSVWNMHRRERRESRLKDEIEKYRIENPKITEQFADIKRKLAEISQDEWEGIPDIGDYSMKNKNKRPQFYSPAPDSLLATAAARNEKDTSIGVASGFDGLKTPAGQFSSLTALFSHSSITALRTCARRIAYTLRFCGIYM